MSLLTKLSDLLDLAHGPVRLRKVLLSRPMSIASMRLHVQLLYLCPGLKTIIDAGANVGQFARAGATVFPSARILSIEPVPDVAAQLRNNLSDCPQVTVYETCVGDIDGRIKINRNAYTQASSILNIRSDSGKGGDLATAQVEVPIGQLDNVLPLDTIQRPCLLKLDLQGYELAALRGAEKLLQQVDFVVVETAFREMYEGEPVFRDIEQHLNERGFRFLRPLAFLQLKSAEIIQMDALFVRAEWRSSLSQSLA